MAEHSHAPAAPPLNRQLRAVLQFILCLGLILWLALANMHPPRIGVIGIVPLVPAVIMMVQALGLLALRGGETPACALAVHLAALAILSKHNVTGLVIPALGRPSAAPPQPGFAPVEVVWTYLLGIAPLYFGWRYAAWNRGLAFLRANWRRVAALAAAVVLAQGVLLLAAVHAANTRPEFAGLFQHIRSPYHRLLIAAAPILFVEHIVCLWQVWRRYRTTGRARNRALFLVFGASSLFILACVLSDVIDAAWMNLAANAIGYVVPLTLIYSVETYGLFEIRILIPRKQQVDLVRQALMLTTFIPVLMLAFVWGVAQSPRPPDSDPVALGTLLNWLYLNEASISKLLIGVFIAALLLRVPLLAWFGRDSFRDIQEKQRMLGDMARDILVVNDPDEVVRLSVAGLDRVFHPVNILFIAASDDGPVCLAYRSRKGFTPPSAIDPAILAVRGVRQAPDSERRSFLLSGDETDALPSSTRQLLSEGSIELIAPLRAEDRTIAVILLGEKRNGSAYAPEEIDLLRVSSSQLALAFQSALISTELLHERTREMVSGSVSLVEVFERERRLLAADLHDQTLPELRCLLADLQALAESESSPPEAQPAPGGQGRMTPQEMVDHLRQTIENIRDIMESLRPSALEMLGLHPAIESELRKACSGARPRIVPQFRLLDETLPEGLTTSAEVSVFRIVQEAVNNACRHGNPDHIRVQIGCDSGDWMITVEDDGVGMPGSALESASGHGLDNMRYRASLIGARLEWGRRDDGSGTRVTLRMALHPSESTLPGGLQTGDVAAEV
jgi:signal transduction histidine kinase